MQLIVLAAGKGSRLLHLTKNSPKISVKLPNGLSILDVHLHLLGSIDRIDEMRVVTGYESSNIEAKLLNQVHSKPVSIQYNPFYEISGPVISIWLSLINNRDDDFILCNGDTIYHKRVFDCLIQSSEDRIVLGITRSALCCPDDMKVILDSQDCLANVGKNILPGQEDGISAGLLLVKGKESRRAFLNALDNIVRSADNLKTNVPWHHLLNNLAVSGVNVYTKNLAKEDWFEIDTITDLEELERHHMSLLCSVFP